MNAVVPKTEAPDDSRLGAILAGVKRGDRRAEAEWRRYLERTPTAQAVYGDLPLQLRLVLLANVRKVSPCAAEAVGMQLKSMQNDLAGNNPSPLESLVVDRLVLCWLYLHVLELLDAEESTNYLQRMIDRAHRRFLSACRALAVIRRIPVAQTKVSAQNLGNLTINNQ